MCYIYLTTNEFIYLQYDMEIYIIYTAEGIKYYASFVTYIVSIIRNRCNFKDKKDFSRNLQRFRRETLRGFI